MLQGENTPQRIHFDFAKGKSSLTKAKIDQGWGGEKSCKAICRINEVGLMVTILRDSSGD